MDDMGNIFGSSADMEDFGKDPFEDLDGELEPDFPFSITEPKPDDKEPDSEQVSVSDTNVSTELEPKSEPPKPAPAQPLQPPESTSDSDDDNGTERNPLMAAVKEQEQKQVQSIFALPPVFSFAAVIEDIPDAELTFEGLRAAKAADFPELEEAARVSWSVSYGTITKAVSKQTATKIHEMKTEIERSKEFLEALKKAKDKAPRCLVKPTVTAQKKGQLPSYKGVFRTLADARSSDKVISLIPGKDGDFYERRVTETGEFITKSSGNFFGTEDIRAGFTPALPPLPHEMVSQIISFFREVMHLGGEGEFEALVNVYWDKEESCYVIDVPFQTVSKASVETEISYMDDGQYVHVMDIHSHNSMPATFSLQDNLDERATRVYVVIGKMDSYQPEITARICNGGVFLKIPVEQVFETEPASSFNQDWLQRITFRGKESDAA